MRETAKIIKQNRQITKKYLFRGITKMEKTGTEGNSFPGWQFIFCCVAHAFVLELWQIV